MPNELLLTVHGVGYPANWQSRVRGVLSPFFEYRPIEYPQYQAPAISAVIKVLLAPVAFWSAVALAILQVVLLLWLRTHGSARNILMWFPAMLALVSFGVGIVLAFFRREKAFLAVRRQVEAAVASGKTVHVVAHSLGTYMAARVLEEIEGIKMGRVIFVGSVVRRRFPWDRYTSARLHAVRNEIGTRDAVVVLAGLVKCLNWRLGWAGWWGFKGSPAVVHTSGDCTTCGPCSVSDNPVPVHNTVSRLYKHNDHFLGPLHAYRFWLPFLWGYDVGTFHLFLDRCQKAVKEADNYDAFRETIESLQYASWGEKRVVAQHIVKQLRRRLNLNLSEHPPPAKVLEIVTHMWNAIVEAQEAIGNPGHPDREKSILAYNPLIAINRAIEKVYP
jgi:hypothetical protein